MDTAKSAHPRQGENAANFLADRQTIASPEAQLHRGGDEREIAEIQTWPAVNMEQRAAIIAGGACFSLYPTP